MPKYGKTKAKALAKLAEKLGEYEPFFVLRAQDMLAPGAVDHYAKLLADNKDYAGAEEVFAFASRMRDWQEENSYKVKMPD